MFEFSFWKVILLFFGGIFFRTFLDYIAHLYLLHLEPKSETGQKIVYFFHGNQHHEAWSDVVT